MATTTIDVTTPAPLNSNSPAGKKALITGITGQDGSYLSELLLDKGYEVHGLIRRSSSFNTSRINHLYTNPTWKGKFFLHYGDLTDSTSLVSIVAKVQPDEVYNLAAQSHVKVSFEMGEYTANVDALGTLRLLDALISVGLSSKVKFYQASTSELYGKVREIPQTEETPFYPRSPYGVAKQFGFWITVNYREAYNIHASNGILFNHESPRRGPTFVTRKITRAVARIHKGIEKCVYLGNIDSQRDWGHAREYVAAMWMMLQQEKADDYVIATGETHSVREFLEKAFGRIGLKLTWEGEGANETAKTQNGDVVVRIDPRYYRPTEVDILLGSPEKARKAFGWKTAISFDELVNEMVDEDIKMLESGELHF